MRARVQPLVPDAVAGESLEDLLRQDLDGLVIATPSALHAQQALAALERGVAVFCQKPLARTAAENAAVVEAARKADLLLGCDLSYRHTDAMRRVRNAVVEGELGQVFAADLVFHNAYGPDKSWARDPALAGGGCAIDLGIHLVDLALWTLGFPRVEKVTSRLYARGQPLPPGSPAVEDYAVAQIELATGAVVRVTCSWNSSIRPRRHHRSALPWQQGWRGDGQRERLVLRLHGREVPRHPAHAPGRSARCLGRTRDRRLGEAARRGRPLRPADRDDRAGCHRTGPHLWPVSARPAS
jgi:predicted dehydrogenase